MKLKKMLSILLALVMVVSATAIAFAESATPAATKPAATTAAEVTAAPVTYTLDQMLNMAMSDAYARHAAYAVYAEAFPDSESLKGINLDTQIVLLEMLLKANGAALPTDTTDVTAPATKDEAYQAVLDAENKAVAMYQSFLKQEGLPEDAKIIFHSVLQGIRNNAETFVWQARSEQQAEQWKAMLNGDNAKVYTLESPWGNGQWTVYVYNSNPSGETTVATDSSTTTTDTGAGDSVSN
jgi:hypothetical protein